VLGAFFYRAKKIISESGDAAAVCVKVLYTDPILGNNHSKPGLKKQGLMHQETECPQKQ
jgi:hypothetical protein